MNRQTGAILLVTGTCIGSGMMALPLVLAPIGLIPTFFLTFLIWGVMYYTSLMNLELNLQAGRGMSLGQLGGLFSGKIAETLGWGSVKLLSYALLSVFLYGGTSVLQKLGNGAGEGEIPFSLIGSLYGGVAFLFLLCPLRLIDYMNRVLFLGLILIFFILMGSLLTHVNFQKEGFPWFMPAMKDISSWQRILPVVFTSFGFQVIFHSLTNYCQRDSQVLKRAFFWGSLIPALVYFLWSGGVLTILFQSAPLFYERMCAGQVDVGELVHQLTLLSSEKSVQLWVWWISILAIVTSLLGVGIGIVGSLEELLAPYLKWGGLRRVVASALTVFPPLALALSVPRAFLSLLGFAGLILAFIAILLPAYLFYQIKDRPLHYKELKSTTGLAISLAIGGGVVLSEIFLLMGRLQ